MRARPIEEWHEDMGQKLWWCLRGSAWLDEAPYVGSPLDCGLTVECNTRAEQPAARFNVGGWPGYHTHFTDMPERPETPEQTSRRRKADSEAFARDMGLRSW
ncbi:hypothetical protein HPDFL43_05665 [Hoeflea phototrophica DFL-43]|uniref:Uncharacterized protein n=1 Tax=Hoeflea phototrophica (strain DSM 17068 / NCIMB 14078 / DFL-43) TaxID=411684 RepID=A9D4N3_HOEPD|nr:hypothetical protein [Hoeflea phototrophica]EDQ33916.2 hypothetical protein HPDFL43_05665 [Hoeflea phototrophica DFL-43]